MDKTLWSAQTGDAPIQLMMHEDANAESRFVAQKCLGFLGQGRKPSDIAILYRANSQAKLIEMALREAGIPARTFGGQSFFERKEVKDFLGYLRLIHNPDDHLALWRVINTPARGIGLKTQEQIDAHARAHDMSPFRALATVKPLTAFVAAIEELAALPLNVPEDLAQLGQAIIAKFDLENHVRAMSTNVIGRNHRLENLRSLPRWLERCAQEVIARHGNFDSRRLLDAVTLDDTPGKRKEEEGAVAVSLMTIHASKGLEFPAVILVGLEDELLPHKNSITTLAGIAEERRLFYVALTRAKEQLVLSYAQMRQTGFQREPRKPSRFLAELPKEGVQMMNQEAPPAPVEERKRKTLGRLAALQDSLREDGARG